MNFTKQEKIYALTRLGYTVKDVDAYDCFSRDEDIIKVTVALWVDEPIDLATDITILGKYGIDNVFEKEYKRLILEMFQR